MDDDKNLINNLPGPSLWDKAGLWSLYLLAFLLPLWVLPVTANPLGTNKIALSYLLIIAAFVFWILGRIKAGSVTLPKNYIVLSLALMVIIWFISGVFSLSRHVSFFELNDDPSSFFSILMFTFAALVAYFYLRSPDKAFFWFASLFASSFVVFVTHFLRMFFGLNPFFWAGFQSATSNVLGSWTDFGFFFSLIAVFSVFLFEVLAEKRLKMIFLGLAVLSFFAILVVANNVILWISLAFFLAILTYFISGSTKRTNVFRASLFAMLLILLFIQVPVISSSLISYLGADSLEVRPSLSASWTVVQKSIEGNALLGSGPATFVYDWLRFKPLEVNESIFWAVRFSGGLSFAVSLLASIGILGFLAFLFMVASFVYYSFKVFIRSGQARLDSMFMLVLLGAFMILTYSFVYNQGFVLTLFLFLFLGMFMAFISEYGIAKEYNLTLSQGSGSGFISSLAIIFLLIISFSGIYVFGQRYASAYFFGRALEKSAAGDVGATSGALQKAISLGSRDVYHRAAAELSMGQIAPLLSRSDLSAEDLRGNFQNILSQAVQNAQAAIDLNPADPLNWFTLGRVYESIIPFQIGGASDLASSAYVSAEKTYPTSPEPVLARARVALALNNLTEARSLLERSLELKSNYTPAHFLLAQIEDAEGNLGAAISRAEAVVILSPNDIGALFQLGLLYYRAERWENARVVFERAIVLSPNYSNARYFLGLIHDRLGRKDLAIEQFEQVKSFNPDNAEVKKILENLNDGKNALSGIAPPPEERAEPPVEEE